MLLGLIYTGTNDNKIHFQHIHGHGISVFQSYNSSSSISPRPHWKFPDLFAICLKCKNSLTFYKIPWLFPDLEKSNFSLTFPWPVWTLLTLNKVVDKIAPCGTPSSWWNILSGRIVPKWIWKVLSDKKLPIKMGKFPRNPMLCKSLRIPYFHVVS